MRPVVIAANWKMNTVPADAGELARTIASRTREPGVTRVICPPYVCLAAVRDALEAEDVGVGAQNVHHEAAGIGVDQAVTVVEHGAREVQLNVALGGQRALVAIVEAGPGQAQPGLADQLSSPVEHHGGAPHLQARAAEQLALDVAQLAGKVQCQGVQPDQRTA